MCHKSRTRVVYPSHTQQFSHEIYKFDVFSCYHYSLFYFKQVCTNRCVHTIFICRLSLFIVCYFSYHDLILSLDLCTELLFLFHYSQTCGLYTYHGSYCQSVCLHQMLFNSICITLTVLLMSMMHYCMLYYNYCFCLVVTLRYYCFCGEVLLFHRLLAS